MNILKKLFRPEVLFSFSFGILLGATLAAQAPSGGPESKIEAMLIATQQQELLHSPQDY